MADPLVSAQTALGYIRTRMEKARRRFGAPPDHVELVAVSKTFSAEAVEPFLAAGQRVFGENRVQEAREKWPALRERYPDLQLHLIGPLQTNKAREAVALFDVIETVDRDRLAGILAEEMARAGKSLPCFVQVNIGEEEQKGGCAIADVAALLASARGADIPVIGLMCVPPVGIEAAPFFALLAKMAADNGLGGLSMGMSEDFETAVMLGATHVRVGSALFGMRR